MIYLHKYMERRIFITTLLIAGLFIFASIFLMSHLLVMQGAVKERAEKECVDAIAIKNWEDTLNIAQAICIDAQNDYREDIKSQYELRIAELEKDAKYWKDSYFWLKRQSNGSNTEEK
jgi:hypothetical protein